MKEKEPIYWRDTRGIIHEIPAKTYETGAITGFYERMGVITERSEADLRAVRGNGGKEQTPTENTGNPTQMAGGKTTLKADNKKPVQGVEEKKTSTTIN